MGGNDFMTNRRNVLKGFVAGGAGFLVGGMPVLAQSATKLTFMEPFDLAFEYIHEMNGVVGGHFEREGLDVEISSIRNTSAAIQQVVTNQAITARVGLLDVFRAQEAQDEPVFSVGTSLHRGIFSVVSRSSDPIKKPEDFAGKTVGLASLGGGQENMLNLLLAGTDVPFDKVVRQPIGSNAGNVEILKQGRVDAFLATVETALLLKMNNEPVEIWPASNFAPLPGGVLLMTKKQAQENEETVVKFLRAMRNSALDILASDPAVILDRITAKYDVVANENRDFRIAAIKAYNEMTVANGEANVMRNVDEVIEKSAELASRAKIVAVKDVKGTYTNQYIDAAIAG
jgi:NitT/TauT family transport system substrate-binding protein